ncbi:glycoside hydrolase family 3 C-terminal domain-containing protein [Nocardioides plantarum]|uniref:Glycoside hydrolase family 3 C-terminal domain-containing protein n=1 Tax=Nocardioides plantarum TaxID=29299 RepID=A0ABV5KG76_9ACTN|nr:glycoside hydrolase family 3 C-terminal domain-containing protein [Nocardioides plantarum]
MPTPPREISAGDLTVRQQVSLLSGQDFWHTQGLPEVGLEPMMMSDGPHGLRAQLAAADHLGLGGSEPATCFPPAVTLGSTWDPTMAAEVGVALAEEARDLGVGVVLGPGVNIKRHPLGGRSFEYLSEDPLLSGRMAAAMVAAIQSRGVGASLKHFAVNSHESHRFTYSAVVDDRTLREIYLRAFEIVVTQARPWTVMCAYNAVNGTPASQHRWLLGDVLRDEWGFDGVVVSDWGATYDRVAGVAAGLDLEMPGGASLSDREVVAAVRDGRLDAAVEASAQRVIDLVARTRTTTSSGSAPGSSSGAVTSVDEHDELCRRVAAAGTVLLTNDGLLPLATPWVGEVALIGAFAESPRYQGAGSSSVVPTRVTSARDALAAAGLPVTYARGYDLPVSRRDDDLVAEAVEVARRADVAVVLVGLPPSRESEGFDRDDLALPEQHDRLVRAVCAANPRTVVVLSHGAPVALPWRDLPAAIVETYLGGQAGGAALVDVLIGAAEPGGRLAESFPVQQEDVAADPWFPGRPRQVDYREGIFVGYRHHTTSGIRPAFPFGHGLSYATFAWTDAAVSDTVLSVGEDGTVPSVVVTVTVANTGDRAGSQVVQVYRADLTGVVLRPRRELVGFAKVHLAAGEQRRVEITVDSRGFAFWDVTQDGWRIPTGELVLEVGRSSEDIVFELPLSVEGGVTTSGEPVDTPPVSVLDADFAARLGRPIPVPVPPRPFSRDSTLEELALTPAGRALSHVAARVVRSRVGASADADTAGEAELVLRSLREIPLRSMASFAGGRVGWGVVDSVVDLLEGRPRPVLARVGSVVRRRLGRRRP